MGGIAAHESSWLIFMVVTPAMPGMHIKVHGGSLMFILVYNRSIVIFGQT